MKQNQSKTKSAAAVRSSDLLAFVGVRKIIGDPTGKLMQDEVAERIAKLVKVLQQTVGLSDAYKILGAECKHPKGKQIYAVASKEIISAISEVMPEWDDVLKAVYEANK